MKLKAAFHHAERPNTIEVYIYSDRNEFIGHSVIESIKNTDFLEVKSSLARPKFGKLLYDFMAMYAEKENKFLVSSRDGDTRTPALKHWKRLFAVENDVYKVRLPDALVEEINEFTNVFDDPCLFYGYQKPSNELFKESLANVEDIDELRMLRFSTRMLFSHVYSDDSNKMINDMMPLTQNSV